MIGRSSAIWIKGAIAIASACAVGVALAYSAANAATAVSGISANAASVARFDKFEVRFQVDGLPAGVNHYWPYDPSPAANTPQHPNAVPPGIGVTVDGLFLAPGESNWDRAIVQPAFYYQDYERGEHLRTAGNRDWLYPNGDPCWMIRFAPTAEGQWRYRVRVIDSQGSVLGPENTFVCAGTSGRGFVQVGAADYRYFETSDGSHLSLIGLHDDYTKTYDMDQFYPELAAKGLNLIRTWWQGSQGPILFGISGQGGIPDASAVYVHHDVARPGQLFSGKLSGDTVVSMPACVKPERNYLFSIWVKTEGITGSGDCGLYLQAFDCTRPDVPLTEKLKGSRDWTLLSTTIRTKPNQYSIGWLKLVLSGVDAGIVWWTDFSLREDLGGGRYGPELVPLSNLNRHQYYSQFEAFKADYQVELCRRLGIYLKACVQEKADQIFGSIQADGTAGPRDDNNVYASDSHASRTYQKYFWRYLVARYGYATSIHSFEFCNEGDPFNGNHINALQAFSSFFAQNDPNRHLCTTSNWHSYPSTEMWQAAADVGYTDWHQYIGKQTNNNLQYIYGWFGVPEERFVTNIHRSPPRSLHASGDGRSDYRLFTYPIPITPGHVYTVSWYMKGQNVRTHDGLDISFQYPTIGVGFKTGWWGYETGQYHLPWAPAKLLGTFDWTPRSVTVTAPDDAHYIELSPQIHWCVGDVWFDDITIRDDTIGQYIECPNGNLDSERLDFDSALMSYSVGTQVGLKGSRQVRKPIIRGEVGISGDNIHGSPYRGIYYSGENQELIDDEDGVWYRKFVWAHINPYAVVDMYWWKENILGKGLLRYVRAYQDFVAGIPLNNGNYDDARAQVSGPQLRAWGQKDLVNNHAHLWIDNIPYNWKNVVDGVPVPPASGTVTVSGLDDGSYNVEWWDTTTGTVTRTETVACAGGNIVLSVQNLVSDVACKIRPVPADIELRMTAPNTDVAPGDVVTITVHFTNKGQSEARNAEVTASLPAEMDYVAGSAEASGGTWNPDTKVVSWIISSVPGGATGTRTFQARVVSD